MLQGEGQTGPQQVPLEPGTLQLLGRQRLEAQALGSRLWRWGGLRPVIPFARQEAPMGAAPCGLRGLCRAVTGAPWPSLPNLVVTRMLRPQADSC